MSFREHKQTDIHDCISIINYFKINLAEIQLALAEWMNASTRVGTIRSHACGVSRLRGR